MNLGIWSVSERSRKAASGFGDMQIIDHLDKDSSRGDEVRRTSGELRVFSG